jgi:hypothetical protein
LILSFILNFFIFHLILTLLCFNYLLLHKMYWFHENTNFRKIFGLKFSRINFQKLSFMPFKLLFLLNTSPRSSQRYSTNILWYLIFLTISHCAPTNNEKFWWFSSNFDKFSINAFINEPKSRFSLILMILIILQLSSLSFSL